MAEEKKKISIFLCAVVSTPGISMKGASIFAHHVD
jgi:hypothetical protein